MATFADVETKIRRLTRSVSQSQITTEQIKEYVNTFILYDMPEKLRVLNLKKTFSFYTEPNLGSYTTGTTTELEDFKQKYLTVHAPFYCAGSPLCFTTEPEILNNQWAERTSETVVATGDGVTLVFAGILDSKPIQRGNVLFSGINSVNVGLKLYDETAGLLTGDGVGIIDYISGAYTLNFTTAPAVGTSILAQVYPYEAGRPSTIMFYSDTFTIRPIPDKVYKISFQVQCRPTDIWDDITDSPMLEENWQYIAYGSAKKIFQDRMDMESVQNIEPELKELELQALRRTLVQNKDKRSATIFCATAHNSFDPFNRF